MSTIRSFVSPDSEEFKENAESYEELLEEPRDRGMELGPEARNSA